MNWKNDENNFGAIAKALHWVNAVAFIGAYIIVYWVIWFINKDSPSFLPVLNIHWILGSIVGFLVIPRLIWRLCNIEPTPPPGSALEHKLATAAHWALYALMIILPITGYLGTSKGTNFGLFEIPSFRDTAAFVSMSSHFGFTWKEFEEPLDVVHHFTGKWIAWGVVLLHIAAAFYHHLVRRDNTLIRMLPRK